MLICLLLTGYFGAIVKKWLKFFALQDPEMQYDEKITYQLQMLIIQYYCTNKQDRHENKRRKL